MMILMTLLTSSIAVSKPEEEKTEEEKTADYIRCVKRYPCVNDDVPREKLTEHEKVLLNACRLSRLLKCSMPETDE